MRSVECPKCFKHFNPKFRTDDCPHEAPAGRVQKFLRDNSMTRQGLRTGAWLTKDRGPLDKA